MCTSNRDDHKLDNTVKQSQFKHLGELHKEWTEAGVSASRVTVLRHLQEKEHFWNRNIVRSILPGIRRKITGLLLSGPKSSLKMKVNFAFHLETFQEWLLLTRVWRKSGEAHNPCCFKSSVKFPQSVMIWAAMLSAGVGPLCFLKSTVNAAIYQEHLEHFMLPSANLLLSTCPHCQRYQKLVQWPWCYCAWLASKPALPEPENLWSIVKRKMRDTRPNNANDLKAAIKATWASITPEQCHRLIASMPRRIDAVIHAKGGPTKYRVHRNKHTFQKPDISV